MWYIHPLHIKSYTSGTESAEKPGELYEPIAEYDHIEFL